MDQYHRFILQPYGDGKFTRFTCPSCQKPRQFTRYLDQETGEYLHESVGSCNRANKCGYHYTPKAYFSDNPQESHLKTFRKDGWNDIPGKFPPLTFRLKEKEVSPVPTPISFIPMDKVKETFRLYGKNNFSLFLRAKFGLETANRLLRLYHIGTSSKWPGSTIFWQVDQGNRVRTGKIMLYDKESGKRIKKPYNRIFWAHKTKGQDDFHLVQCLFGEHLLGRFPNKPVEIVESEKTAIICSVYLPKYIWLAAGGLSLLSKERCSVLKGRKVTLFPDLGAFDRWQKKARELKGITPFKVSDKLERIATEAQRKEGLDLADFLLRLPPLSKAILNGD